MCLAQFYVLLKSYLFVLHVVKGIFFPCKYKNTLKANKVHYPRLMLLLKIDKYCRNAIKVVHFFFFGGHTKTTSHLSHSTNIRIGRLLEENFIDHTVLNTPALHPTWAKSWKIVFSTGL